MSILIVDYTGSFQNAQTSVKLLKSLDIIINRALKINQLQTAIEKFRICSN